MLVHDLSSLTEWPTIDRDIAVAMVTKIGTSDKVHGGYTKLLFCLGYVGDLKERLFRTYHPRLVSHYTFS